MRPTPDYIDNVLTVPLLEAVAPHLSPTARPLHHGAESLAGLFDVPADTNRPIAPAPLTDAPYRGLISRTLPEDVVGSIALIWDGGGVEHPGESLWAVVVTRHGSVRAVRSTDTSEVVTLDQLHPKAAVIAALLLRAMGRPVDRPDVPVLRPMIAHIWARACNARMRRNGERLGTLEAMALDPLNDPPPLVRCADDLGAFYRTLEEQRASFWLRTPDGRPGPVNVADHLPWIDVGTLGWILRDTARPPALTGAALRRCLLDDAFEAVTSALHERGWFPAPKSHAESLALAECRRRNTNPFDAPEPFFALGRLGRIEDRALAGAVIGGHQRRHARLRVPATAGEVPPVGAATFLAAYAWARSRDGEQLNTVDLDSTLADGAPDGGPVPVFLVGQGIIDYQAPLAGLGRWDVPAAADGVVFVVRTADDVELCERAILSAPPDPATVVPPRPPEDGLLVVAVDRSGAVAIGRPEDDLAERHFGRFEPNPTHPQVRRLFLRSVAGLAALEALPTAGLAAAVGRRILGLTSSPADDPPVPEAIGQYLASVWSGSLVEAAGSLGETLGAAVARALDPAAAPEFATVFADGTPSWDSITRTPAVNPLSPPPESVARERHLASLGELYHRDVIAWTCAVLSWDWGRIVRGVEASCGPAAGDDVLTQMATRSWLPAPALNGPHFP